MSLGGGELSGCETGSSQSQMVTNTGPNWVTCIRLWQSFVSTGEPKCNRKTATKRVTHYTLLLTYWTPVSLFVM